MRNSFAVKVENTLLMQQNRPIFLPFSTGSTLMLVHSVDFKGINMERYSIS